jgi:antitoxin VapB
MFSKPHFPIYRRPKQGVFKVWPSDQSNRSWGLTTAETVTSTGLGLQNGRIITERRICVSLNIKDPEAHRLAQKIAEATGETMTRAVISSLRERLERLHLHGRAPEALAADIRSIAKRASSGFKGHAVDHGEFLYDEQGLPK